MLTTPDDALLMRRLYTEAYQANKFDQVTNFLNKIVALGHLCGQLLAELQTDPCSNTNTNPLPTAPPPDASPADTPAPPSLMPGTTTC